MTALPCLQPATPPLHTERRRTARGAPTTAANDDQLSGEEQVEELTRLCRIAFYHDLGRRAPTQVTSLPSYVRSVKRHFNLVSGNQAREMIATVEGYKSWRIIAQLIEEAKTA